MKTYATKTPWTARSACRAGVAGAWAAAALLTAASCDSAQRHPGWREYGTPTAASHVDPTPIASLRGGERDVVLDGTVVEVCQVKGCWLTLRDASGEEIFVRFHDYAFFVPRNAPGHRAVVRGYARAHLATVEELRHFAEDAGRSPEEIAAIVAPQERVEFTAHTVWIEGDDLAEPHRP